MAAIARKRQLFVEYIAGTSLISGDLVYISSENKVSRLALNDPHEAIGLVVSSASFGERVKILKGSGIIKGILQNATPNTRYFWTGLELSTTPPMGNGENVWLCGMAKNTSDLHVAVRHIKRRG